MSLETALKRLGDQIEDMTNQTVNAQTIDKKNKTANAGRVLDTLLSDKQKELTYYEDSIGVLEDNLNNMGIDLDNISLEDQTTDAFELAELANESTLDLLGGLYEDVVGDIEVAKRNEAKLKKNYGLLQDVHNAIGKADPGEDFVYQEDELMSAYQENFVDLLKADLSGSEQSVVDEYLLSQLGPKQLYAMQLDFNKQMVAEYNSQIYGLRAKGMPETAQIKATDDVLIHLEEARDILVKPIVNGLSTQLRELIYKESELSELDAVDDEKDYALLSGEIEKDRSLIGATFYPWSENRSRMTLNAMDLESAFINSGRKTGKDQTMLINYLETANVWLKESEEDPAMRDLAEMYRNDMEGIFGQDLIIDEYINNLKLMHERIYSLEIEQGNMALKVSNKLLPNDTDVDNTSQYDIDLQNLIGTVGSDGDDAKIIGNLVVSSSVLQEAARTLQVDLPTFTIQLNSAWTEAKKSGSFVDIYDFILAEFPNLESDLVR